MSEDNESVLIEVSAVDVENIWQRMKRLGWLAALAGLVFASMEWGCEIALKKTKGIIFFGIVVVVLGVLFVLKLSR